MMRSPIGERGFTLVEVLIAIALLAIGLLGITAAGVQSGGIAASISFGQAAVTRGHYVSTATMLAQQRLEQLKRLQYTLGPPVVDQILPSNEGFGTIPGFPNFSRQVSVQNGVPAANMKIVTVTVNFRLPKETGIGQENLVINTIIAARP